MVLVCIAMLLNLGLILPFLVCACNVLLSIRCRSVIFAVRATILKIIAAHLAVQPLVCVKFARVATCV